MNRLKGVFIIWVLLLSLKGIGQDGPLSFEELNDLPFFFSLDEAKAKPDSVFKLYLVNAGLKEIPPEIFKMKNLQMLYLDSNEIKRVPDEISDLRFLQVLSLGDNSIKKLPSSIGRLGYLALLYLNDNQLTSLPESVTTLINLEGLYIEKNRIGSLPAGFGKLDKLFLIWANDNDLSDLPEDLANAKGLGSLSLTNNRLSSIPENFVLLNRLEKLFLSGNKIEVIPDMIGKMSGLRILLLDNNRISKIPKTIGDLNKLHTLYLSDNSITRIPKEITACDSLRFLSLSNNSITRIPSEIANLKQLQTLALRSNPIRMLPDELGKMENLRKLYINDIDLSRVPESVLSLEAKGVDVIGLKSPINYRAIKKHINTVGGPYEYKVILDKYFYSLDDLSSQEYRHLYYGYVFQEAYQPYGLSDDEKKFFEYFRKNEISLATKSALNILAYDPFNLEVVYDLYLLYDGQGKNLLANKWLDRYFGLMEAIKSTGTGISKETPFAVNRVSDEYHILGSYGLKKTKQQLSGSINVITVKSPNKYGIDKVYFDLSKALEKMDK